MTAALLLGALWAGTAGAVVLLATPGPGRRLPSARPDPPVPAAAPASTTARWRIALAIAAIAVLISKPAMGLVAGGAFLLLRRARSRTAERRRENTVVDQLPDVVDLLVLTTLAGLPVAAALALIRDRPGGVCGAALAGAAAMVERGASTAESIRSLGVALGPPGRGLVEALADHDRYGTPLGPILDRVGLEARHRRRRRAEEAARRLPVTLLFPLVFATLPAFVLLTIVPLLVSAFSSVRL